MIIKVHHLLMKME